MRNYPHPQPFPQERPLPLPRLSFLADNHSPLWSPVSASYTQGRGLEPLKISSRREVNQRITSGLYRLPPRRHFSRAENVTLLVYRYVNER